MRDNRGYGKTARLRLKNVGHRYRRRIRTAVGRTPMVLGLPPGTITISFSDEYEPRVETTKA